ncbi:MAG: preprotein translocase subunit SecG [Alphaproteobacteria bacterium]|nr:preprotein translocase subunit SecG [Alphaproteobacteria bacterium]
MQTVLIVFHIIVSLLLVSVILFQRTSSDELKGIGGGVSDVDGLMSSASSANFMTKLTSILAAIFMINCLVMANLSSRESDESIVKKVELAEPSAVERTLPMAE